MAFYELLIFRWIIVYSNEHLSIFLALFCSIATINKCLLSFAKLAAKARTLADKKHTSLSIRFLWQKSWHIKKCWRNCIFHFKCQCTCIIIRCEYDYIFLKVEEVKRFCKADQKLEFGYTYICIWGVFWAYVSLSINKEVFEAIFECFESYSHLISW